MVNIFLSYCSLLLFSSPTIIKQIEEAALSANLDPKLIHAIVKVESDFNPNATSHKGAMGLMQVTSLFANECGISNPYHIVNNLMGACNCIRKLMNLYKGNLSLVLAAYNAGIGNVERYNGIPPFVETRKYISKVLDYYEKLKKMN